MLRHFLLKIHPQKALIIGLLFLLLASVLLWSSSRSEISTSDRKECEQHVKSQNNPAPAELLALCASSVGWVAQQKATVNGETVQAVAIAMSQANKGSLGFHTVIMFFVGLFLMIGVVMTALGTTGLAKTYKRPAQ